MIDLSTKRGTQLDTIIARHVAEGTTEDALYREAVAEKARRGRSLDPQRTMEAIRKAARDGRLLTFDEIATASGADIKAVRSHFNKHVGDIARAWSGPLGFLLHAIVVQSDGVMDKATYDRFLRMARMCKLHPSDVDGPAFLKQQQERVFAWGQKGAPL